MVRIRAFSKVLFFSIASPSFEKANTPNFESVSISTKSDPFLSCVTDAVCKVLIIELTSIICFWRFNLSKLSIVGIVFAIIKTVVNPPLADAREPV